MLRIGMIGYGTIGSTLARAIGEGKAGDAVLVAVHDILEEAPFPAGVDAPFYSTDVNAFLLQEMDLVIEAAAQSVLRSCAPLVLNSGRSLVAMSVGAFADENLLAELTEVAKQRGVRIYLPAGAIGGLDALSAAAIDEIDTVSLTTTKPVAGLKGTRSLIDPELDLQTITEAICIFEGPAEEAVRHFPKNVNVAAALSLSTIGVKETQVRIVADPRAQNNSHRIEAEGKFGRLSLELALKPSPTNPKTSYLASLSAIRLIKNLSETVRIGA